MNWQIDDVAPWRISLSPAWMLMTLAIGIALFYASAELLTAVILELLWFGRERGHLAGKLSQNPVSPAGFRTTVLAFIVLQIVAAVLMIVWQGVLHGLRIPFDDTQDVVKHLQQSEPGARLLLVVVVTTLIPLAEELFFRRVLFGVLLPHLGGMGAMVATALLFSAAHGFLAGFPTLFWMGMCFQWIYWRTGNFLYPVLLHAAVNLWGCALAFLLP